MRKNLIKEQHKEMIDIFSSLLNFESLNSLRERIKSFLTLWNKHETLEENDFSFTNIPLRKIVFAQHKQLRGHWFLLNQAIDSGREDYIRVVLDTDGKMLFDKFKEHFRLEEALISNI